MEYNLWQKLVNRATLPVQYLFGDREKVKDFQESEMNDFAKLLLDTTKPFRTGANIFAQNYGSALTGKDMSQEENQGKFLKMLAGAITPEEQDYINRKPYMAAAKSGAGFGEALISLLVPGYAGFKNVANPLLRKSLQIATRAIPEGALPGFSYSREGKELQDTGIGTALSLLTHFGSNYAFDPQFRKMITEASTYIDPTTGTRMYRGALEDDDIVFDGSLPKTKELPHDLSDLELTEISDYNNPDTKEFFNAALEDTKYPPVDLADDIEITNYQDYDNPLAKLESEAKKYKTPEEFVKAQGTPVYHGTNEVFDNFDLTKSRFKGEQGENLWGFGTYTSPDIRTAKIYGKNILEIPFSPKKPLNLSNFKTTKELADYLDMSEDALIVRNGIPTAKGQQAAQLSSKAQELGHDAIIAGQETVILDPSQIKTKSQLIDIWNKVHNLKDSTKELRGGFKDILEKASRDGIK